MSDNILNLKSILIIASRLKYYLALILISSFILGNIFYIYLKPYYFEATVLLKAAPIKDKYFLSDIKQDLVSLDRIHYVQGNLYKTLLLTSEDQETNFLTKYIENFLENTNSLNYYSLIHTKDEYYMRRFAYYLESHLLNKEIKKILITKHNYTQSEVDKLSISYLAINTEITNNVEVKAIFQGKDNKILDIYLSEIYNFINAKITDEFTELAHLYISKFEVKNNEFEEMIKQVIKESMFNEIDKLKKEVVNKDFKVQKNVDLLDELKKIKESELEKIFESNNNLNNSDSLALTDSKEFLNTYYALFFSAIEEIVLEEDELLETEIKFIEEKINKGLYEDKKFGEMFLLNINKSKVIDSLESIRLKLDSIRQEGSNRKIQFLVKDEPNIKLYTWDRKFVLSLFVIFGLFICFIHIIIYFLLFNLKKQ